VNEHTPAGAKGQRRPGRLGFVVTACLASAALAAPIAIGATGNPLREGVRNPQRGSATKETLIIANTRANVYGTRQSNLGAGGAAIYGCRTTADTNALADTTKSTPCLRVNNLSSGLIHSYRFGTGAVGGVYQAGATDENDPTARPFITNATGVASGLNADRVDGMHADEIIAAGRASLVGPPGPKGDTGATGDQGPRGPAGRGSKWFSGSGAPAGTLGDSQVGDYYINLVASGAGRGDVYEKTGPTTWTQRGNLLGAAGPLPDQAEITSRVQSAVNTYCAANPGTCAATP
jgi:hypothetical protein